MSQAEPFSVTCPTQIKFGMGSSKALLELLSYSTTPLVFVEGAGGTQSADLVRELRRRGQEVLIVCQKDEPSIDTVNAALEQLDGHKISTVVACGGGSVIDTGKVLAALLDNGQKLPADFANIDPNDFKKRRRVESIAIPTTAGTGAEVTPNAVITVPSLAAKISVRGAALFPDIAIVDPLLMKTAPAQVVIQSGLDAITQVIESFTSSAATPFSDALSKPAIMSGLCSLQNIVDHKKTDAWPQMAWASLVSGLALANSGLGAAHGLASVLGGRYDAPHGALCGRFLVPSLRASLRNSPDGSTAFLRLNLCMASVAKIFEPLEGHDLISGLEYWIDHKKVPRLRDLGVQDGDIASLAIQSAEASSSKKNAVPLKPYDFTKILEEAL